MEKLIFLKCYFNGAKICYESKTVNAWKQSSGGFNIDRLPFTDMVYLPKSSFNKIWTTGINYNFKSCVWCKKSDVNIYKTKLLNSLKKDKNKIKKSIELKENEYIYFKEKTEKLLKILAKK